MYTIITLAVAFLSSTTITTLGRAAPSPLVQQQQLQRQNAFMIHTSSPSSSSSASSSTDPRQGSGKNHTVSPLLFSSLEELARLVDISYCVGLPIGSGGISAPFTCASPHCAQLAPWFEVEKTWSLSSGVWGLGGGDGAGYIAVGHEKRRSKGKKGHNDQGRMGLERLNRIVVAFRGTYSIGDVVVDLTSRPQEYVPYPEDGGGGGGGEETADAEKGPRCEDCTVHAGFMSTWQETKKVILPVLEEVREKYPGYKLDIVGHSLGGAIAALAGLEFRGRGWNPRVTTFGEPRIGNQGMVRYLDEIFSTIAAEGGEAEEDEWTSYRRVTHVKDPVPLLPLTEWGYRMHAGEIYISKSSLSPDIKDVRYCFGDNDVDCIAGAEPPPLSEDKDMGELSAEGEEIVALQQLRDGGKAGADGIFEIPARWRIWQLFFAHRDYFWRLGLCIPGGDPADWWRKYPDYDSDEL